MNKLSASQIDKLIETIEVNPIIFDRSHKDYNNFSKKDETWREISEYVGSEEDNCKTAWKSLRDQFVKAYKENGGMSEQEISGKKTYKFYRRLYFLKDTAEQRKQRRKNDSYYFEDLNYKVDPLTEVLSSANNDESNFSESIRTHQTFFSNPSPEPPKKLKKTQDSLQPDECLKEFLKNVLHEIKFRDSNSKSQSHNEQFFSSIATMVNNANITVAQTREIHRTVFNIVSDKLDSFDDS